MTDTKLTRIWKKKANTKKCEYNCIVLLNIFIVGCLAFGQFVVQPVAEMKFDGRQN